MGPEITAGAQLGRFVVVRPLGAGGMGEVYEARDPDLDRSVAVKVLHDEPGEDERSSMRLFREAQALAQLSHPNIVTVHEVGLAEGRVFLAMEYVDGETLARRFADARPSWREALGLYLQAGRGLAAAHARSIVHRDFKPANVLVDREGRVRVSDFGLARLGEAPPAEGGSSPGPSSSSQDSTEVDETPGTPSPPPAPLPAGAGLLGTPLTQVGAWLGTPRYMSPEQRARQPATARSDQFAYCVAFWEALFGEHPFVGDEAEGPRRPPRAGVPRWLVRIVARGLEEDPARRHESMAALVALLEDVPVRRRRVAWAAGLLVVAGGAAAAGLVLRRPARMDCERAGEAAAAVWTPEVKAQIETGFAGARPYGTATAARAIAQLDQYARRWREARVDTCRATHERGEQSGTLLDLRMRCLDHRLSAMRELALLMAREADGAVVDQAQTAVAALPPVETCADREALEAVAPLPATPEARRRIEELGVAIDRAWAQSRAGKAKDALAAANAIVEPARSTAYPPLLAQALELQGEMQMSNEPEKAEATLRDAVRAAGQARDDHRMGQAATNLMWVIGHYLNRSREAIALRGVVEAIIARAGGDADDQAQLDRYAGSILGEDHQWAAAEAALGESLALNERAHGPDSLAVAQSLSSLGIVYLRQDKYDEAERTLGRAVDVFARVLGPDHLDTLKTHVNLGNLALFRRRLPEAEQHFRLAIAGFDAAFGPDAPLTAGVILNLAIVLTQESRWDEAEPLYRAVVGTYERKHGPDSVELATALGNYAQFLSDRGRFEEGEPLARRAVEIVEKKLGADSPRLVGPLNILAEALQGRRAFADALAVARRELALLDKEGHGDGRDAALSHLAAGESLLALGRAVEARTELEAALKIREAKGPDEEVERVKAALTRAHQRAPGP